MNKSKIPVIAIVILAVIILLTFIKNSSPTFWQKIDQSAATPDPTPSYNPPKEIKYDSSTDLKKELDSVDPQVLDSDFEQ